MSIDSIIEELVDRQFKVVGDKLVLKKRRYDKNKLAAYLMKHGICEDLVWIVNNYDDIIETYPEEVETAVNTSVDNVQWAQNYFKFKKLTFFYDGTIGYKDSDRPFQLEPFMARMKNDAYQSGLKNYDRIIDNELTVAQSNSQQEWRSRKIKELAYNPYIKSDVGKFVDALSAQPHMRDWHIAAVEHWIWQVKRKLNNNLPDYPMMLNFYGPTNSGKTISARRIFSPLQDAVHDANNLLCVKDDRFGKIMQENPVIFLDELAGADKVTAEELKAAITADKWSYRIMHSNQHSKQQNIASFIATSNVHINCMILDPKSARRYWQMTCKPREGLKVHWEELKTLNYLNMWRAVDEKGPTPLTPFLKEILDYQDSELKAESFMKMFLRETYSVDEDNKEPAVAHQIPLRRLEKDFRDWKNDRRVPVRDTSQFIKNELIDLGYEVATKDRQKYVIIETQLSFQSALEEIV